MDGNQQQPSFEPVITPESYIQSQKEAEQHKKEKQRTGKSIKLEDCTLEIIEYLQLHGSATFKEITQQLNIPYRRTSDVLNVEVLQTTPIVTREWEELQPVQGKANVNPYRFYDGLKLPHPCNVSTIIHDIQKEKSRIEELKQQLQNKYDEDTPMEDKKGKE